MFHPHACAKDKATKKDKQIYRLNIKQTFFKNQELNIELIKKKSGKNIRQYCILQFGVPRKAYFS